MALAPATTVTIATLPNEDYHIDTKLWGRYIAPCLELLPQHLDGPQTWKLTCDTYRHLSARRHNATLEEYRAMACEAAYAASANTASISSLEDIQNYPKDSPNFKAAIVTMRQSNLTHNARRGRPCADIPHPTHQWRRGDERFGPRFRGTRLRAFPQTGTGR
jgi:hypothetical protein